MYRDVALVSDKAFASELLPCSLSIILGKVKELNCIYLVRQVHEQRYLLPDMYDWMTSPDWLPSYQVFRNCLTKELVRQDGISLDEARAVVKQAFWSYLAKGFMKKWQGCYGQPRVSRRTRLLQAMRVIPGARQAWRGLRSLLPSQRDEMSLNALLDPSSPYHADFMPIYRSVTDPPPEF